MCCMGFAGNRRYGVALTLDTPPAREDDVQQPLGWARSMDVLLWLRSLVLERYEAAFRENEIDDAVLPNLIAEDLKNLGVGIVWHRRKLLDAVAALRSDGPSVAIAPAQPCRRRQLFAGPRASLFAFGSPHAIAATDVEEHFEDQLARHHR